MRTDLVDLAPRAGPGEVIEAVPAQATYRVLDERKVSRGALVDAREARDDAFERAVFSAVAKTGALFVSFVAMVARTLLGVAMCLSLLVAGAYLLLGAITGVHRFDFVGLFFGVGFGAFVAIFLLTQAELWACRAAGIERR